MADTTNELPVESASGGLTTNTALHPERSRGDANGNTHTWDIENHITAAEPSSCSRLGNNP